jgi:hypothetical protein
MLTPKICPGLSAGSLRRCVRTVSDPGATTNSEPEARETSSISNGPWFLSPLHYPCWGTKSRPVTGARAGKFLWLLRLAEQIGQLGADIDESALVALSNDRVGPLKEVGDLPDRRLEVRLAEGGGQLDVQHAARLAVC